MKIIHGVEKIKKFPKPVVALGVFDGVHRGHKIILQAAVRRTKETGGTSMVVTFWPHPQKEESLYSLEHRLRLIRELGIDVCVVINFSRHFASITAEEFIKKILIDKISAREIYIGRNFRFGKHASGNFKMLESFSRIHNYRVKEFGVIKINGKPISSTCIRRLIKKGNLAAAQKLLTRPVSVLGTVIRGRSLARKLGFPTANIDPHHEVIPPSGVYAVKVICENRIYKGVCNIGFRPTVTSQTLHVAKSQDKHIEVHIFDLNKNLYGEYLEILFVSKIRQEKRYPALEKLASQIQKDIILSKRVFSRQ